MGTLADRTSFCALGRNVTNLIVDDRAGLCLLLSMDGRDAEEAYLNSSES